VAADRKERHRLIGRVENLMGTLFADGEPDGLALFHRARPFRRAQPRATFEHDYDLLVGAVEVVRVGRLAGR
jgi:hypothetical protein